MVLFSHFFQDVQLEQGWGWVINESYIGFSKYISGIIEQNIAEVSRPRVFATIKDRLGVTDNKGGVPPFPLAPRCVGAVDTRTRLMRGRARSRLIGEPIAGTHTGHRSLSAAVLRSGLRNAQAGVQGG